MLPFFYITLSFVDCYKNSLIITKMNPIIQIIPFTSKHHRKTAKPALKMTRFVIGPAASAPAAGQACFCVDRKFVSYRIDIEHHHHIGL